MNKTIITIFLGILTFLLSCRYTEPNASEDSLPNVILFFVDDLGYGDLGCYGQKLIQTPNLDKMAEEGMLFTDFYSASPVCAPSRCSLMTGKHAGEAYIRHNMNILPLGQVPIPDEEITLAEIFKEKGYSTAAMGKWSLGAPGNSGDPLKQGFDRFYGYYCQCKAHNYYPDMIWDNKVRVKLNNKTVPVNVNFIDYPLSYATEKNEYSADLIFREGLKFIEKNKEKPFFLYFASTLPHSNGEAPPDEKFEVPDWGIYKDSAWLPTEKGYASMVTKLDDQIGILKNNLREMGIEKNTLLLFTSDNGPTKFAKRFNSASILRGRKRDLYEGGIRVPFIAWWPETIQPGSRNQEPYATWDLFTSFQNLWKEKITTTESTHSIIPALIENKSSVNRILYWEFYEGQGAPKQAIRKGNWKLVRFFFDDPGRQIIELYNLNSDIGEKINLADKYPDIVSELLSDMTKQHQPYPNKEKTPR